MHPKIELSLVLDDRKLDLIAEQLDLGIRIGYMQDDSLVARVMHQEQPKLFASPAFIAQHAAPTTLQSLALKPWVLPLGLVHNNKVQLLQNNRQIECELTDVYRCNSPLMIQKMVAQGLGIGLLLPTTVRREINRGELVPVMSSLSAQALVFSLVYPSRKQVAARTRVVIDYLLQSQLFNEMGKPT